jgi:hypothetical protein
MYWVAFDHDPLSKVDADKIDEDNPSQWGYFTTTIDGDINQSKELNRTRLRENFDPSTKTRIGIECSIGTQCSPLEQFF